MNVKPLSLLEIRIDANVQIRASIDESVVSAYSEQMRIDPSVFPAIVVFHDGNHHNLADGFHRMLAAQRAGVKELNADVNVGTKEDAIWFALGANRGHGHRLTPADKRHAILLALKTWPERSQTAIAEQIGCNQSTVQRVKVEVMQTHNLPERTTGKDGKSYPASTGKKPSRTPDAISDRRDDGAEAGPRRGYPASHL